MGYRFGDFLDDVVKPVTGIWDSLNPLNKIIAGVQNIAGSLGTPLMIGGAAVLVIVLLKK